MVCPRKSSFYTFFSLLLVFIRSLIIFNRRFDQRLRVSPFQRFCYQFWPIASSVARGRGRFGSCTNPCEISSFSDYESPAAQKGTQGSFLSYSLISIANIRFFVEGPKRYENQPGIKSNRQRCALFNRFISSLLAAGSPEIRSGSFETTHYQP